MLLKQNEQISKQRLSAASLNSPLIKPISHKLDITQQQPPLPNFYKTDTAQETATLLKLK